MTLHVHVPTRSRRAGLRHHMARLARRTRRRGATGPAASRDDRGQSTTEYGLVILVAGAIALGVIAWARESSAFTDLFESVIDQLI